VYDITTQAKDQHPLKRWIQPPPTPLHQSTSPVDTQKLFLLRLLFALPSSGRYKRLNMKKIKIDNVNIKVSNNTMYGVTIPSNPWPQLQSVDPTSTVNPTPCFD
jgi:hypothetical protein